MYIQGEFFYLETSKYLKKYALHERNVRNKKCLFSRGKSDSAKIHPTSWEWKGANLNITNGKKILIKKKISNKTHVFFNRESESSIRNRGPHLNFQS